MAATTTTLSVKPHGIGPNGARLFIVPSRSNPDDRHVVAFVNNQTSCTCNASLYSGHCAHGAAVERYLLDEQRAKYEFKVNPALGLSAIMAPRQTA